MSRPDVIVVGAGPAGAATAILLAERGLEVVVLDRATFPRPKLCGEYLSPESVRILDRLDALKAIDAAGAAPLLGMRITASTAPSSTGGTGRSTAGSRIAATPWRCRGWSSTRSSSTGCGRCPSTSVRACG